MSVGDSAKGSVHGPPSTALTAPLTLPFRSTASVLRNSHNSHNRHGGLLLVRVQLSMSFQYSSPQIIIVWDQCWVLSCRCSVDVGDACFFSLDSNAVLDIFIVFLVESLLHNSNQGLSLSKEIRLHPLELLLCSP